MKVTKAEVEKARTHYYVCDLHAVAEEAAAAHAAEATARAVENSWRNYQKLKEEYEANARDSTT